MIFLDLEKNYLILIKMTITEQIKILNKKIMQNEVQYDLDKKAAEVSTLSSNNLSSLHWVKFLIKGLIKKKDCLKG